MNNLIKNQILRRIFAVLIITLLFLIPVYLMYYFSSESIILDHDLFILYGNNFFAPDHGRYIATAFVNFFVEHLPVISNTHFFDLNKLFVFPVQIFISVIIFSMISSVVRIPAVSITFRVSPCRRICSSSTSLVVPSISVTMALSCPARRFRREDIHPH